MYITPKTDIRLLSGIPIDPNYNDTLYFSSPSDQTSYFMSKTKKNLNNYSYQRYAKNVLRVQILADDIFDVNYMMFRNSAYGNKWFYAFVDKVEYVNDVTTEIYYHLDDIQTWYDSWVLNQCFIERTHTIRDRVGDSITPEPVEVGEYVYNGNYQRINKFQIGNGQGVIIVAITDSAYDPLHPSTLYEGGNIYDGVYSGATLYAYTADADHYIYINQIINNEMLEGHPDSIISIYMVPTDAVPSAFVNSGGPIPTAAKGQAKVEDLGTCGTTVDGHIVRNNKLLTYPYNFVNVNNSDGANLALRYEFFEEGEAKIDMMSTITQPIQVVCAPVNYKNSRREQQISSINIDERLTLAGYPLCSWTYDAWRAWIAQNAGPMVINAASAAGSLALAAYNPATTVGTGLIGAGGKELTKDVPASMDFGTNASIYGLHQISNILTSMYKASIAADPIKGNISSGSATQAQGIYGFWYGRMSINKQQAEVIDSFFDRYGYAVNKIDYPRLHNRKEHTYIKTVNCSIGGNIPADSKRNIENIFDSGITFWANPQNVGNYGAPNDPFLQ